MNRTNVKILAILFGLMIITVAVSYGNPTGKIVMKTLLTITILFFGYMITTDVLKKIN
jgi:hypothetical protein